MVRASLGLGSLVFSVTLAGIAVAQQPAAPKTEHRRPEAERPEAGQHRARPKKDPFQDLQTYLEPYRQGNGFYVIPNGRNRYHSPYVPSPFYSPYYQPYSSGYFGYPGYYGYPSYYGYPIYGGPVVLPYSYGGAPIGGSNFFGNPHASQYMGNPHASQYFGNPNAN